MIDPNVQESSPGSQQHAAPAPESIPETFLAFMANLLGAFASVDPRVITREERRNGRTSIGF